MTILACIKLNAISLSPSFSKAKQNNFIVFGSFKMLPTNRLYFVIVKSTLSVTLNEGFAFLHSFQ